MKDYFDYDVEDIPENEEGMEHYENKCGARTLEELVDINEKFVNKILNKKHLTEADKYNLSGVVTELGYHLMSLNEVSVAYDKLTHEVMGDEWYANMVKKVMQRLGNAFFDRVGAPELKNNSGVYVYKPGEDD